jgi:hypothetical protein
MPYVAILNDDDWWCSNHAQEGLNALEANADAVASCSAALFAADERSTNPRWIDRSDAIWLLAGKPAWVTPWKLDVKALLALCWIYTPFHFSTLIVRTTHLRDVLAELRNDIYYTHTIDRLVFAHLSLRGAFCYNPLPDTFVRWHSDNWTKSQKADELQAVVRSTMEVIEQLANGHGWTPHLLWKAALSKMPIESKSEVGERFHRAFSDTELKRNGLGTFFNDRFSNGRIAALLGIGSSTKRLVLGSR